MCRIQLNYRNKTAINKISECINIINKDFFLSIVKRPGANFLLYSLLSAFALFFSLSFHYYKMCVLQLFFWRVITLCKDERTCINMQTHIQVIIHIIANNKEDESFLLYYEICFHRKFLRILHIIKQFFFRVFFLCLFLDILRRISAVQKTEYRIIFTSTELFVVDHEKEEIS